MDGDLPLYRHQEFERAMKKWLKDSLSTQETNMKISLQVSEREIMTSFAFKKELRGTTGHSSLNEAITIDENNVLVSYTTEFEGDNLETMKSNFKKITPQFKDDTKFMRDTQIVIDENYFNWVLFTMFTDAEQFSLTETLFKYWPN
jgi:hypothetical protein